MPAFPCCCEGDECSCPETEYGGNWELITFDTNNPTLIVDGEDYPVEMQNGPGGGARVGSMGGSTDTTGCLAATLDQETGPISGIDAYQLIRITPTFIEMALVLIGGNVERGAVMFYDRIPFETCCQTYFFINQYLIGDLGTINTDAVALAHACGFTATTDFVVAGYGDGLGTTSLLFDC